MTTQTDITNKEDTRNASLKDLTGKIDFKMVTFQLAGKEYGIDIMNVKEIAKANKFTYVPNAAPFVRGVYNLRGEIISIVDLRTMFHLPSECKQENELESLLIMNVNENKFGIIVDNIDKVVGVSKSLIQQPHPIFSDINIKYIQGILEKNNKLYIILDVDKIFIDERERKMEDTKIVVKKAVPLTKEKEILSSSASGDELDLLFIKESLFSFRNFTASFVNESWIKSEFQKWKENHKGKDLQLKEPGEADQYLDDFFSRSNLMLWDFEYYQEIEKFLPEIESKTINVWNPGCNRGYETYSLAVLLKKKYPDSRIKIWANDSDLLGISMAANMVFQDYDIPEYCYEYMVKGKNGWTFSQEIKDSIFFEFHDIRNANPLPQLDIILCRDTISYIEPEYQDKLILEFHEKLKENGLIIIGDNEELEINGWKRISKDDNVSIWRKTESK